MNSQSPPVSPSVPRGSLRDRVSVIVGLTVVVLLVALGLTSMFLIERIFGDLQDELTRQRITRVAEAVELSASAKMDHVRDSAEWDDTYEYAGGENPEFFEENFSPETDSSQQDVIMVFDTQKQLLGAAQPSNEDEPFSPPDGLKFEALAADTLMGSDAAFQLFVSDEGVIVLAACPILRSNREGPPRGWMVYGSYLDDERLAEIAAVSGAGPIRVTAGDTFTPAPQMKMISAGGAMGAIGYYSQARNWKEGAEPDASALLIPSASRTKTIALEFPTNLDVFQRALVAKRWIVGASIISAVIIGLVGWLTLRHYVLKPLAVLDHSMAEMAASERQEGALPAIRADEIGRLAQSANRLLDKVIAGRTDAEQQRALLDSVLDSALEGVLAFRAIRSAAGEIFDFELVVANEAAETVFGWKRGEFVGAGMIDSLPPMKASGVFDRCVQVTVTRKSDTFEVFYNGVQMSAWLRFSICPWKDGIVMTFEDVTSRKTKERDLAESYAEIERFNAAMIGREERIIQIKTEVNALRERLGEAPLYQIPEDERV